MKTATIALTCLLSGCATMTPAERTTAMIVGGVVVTAVVLSAGGSSSAPPEQDCHFVITGDRSERVCN